MESNYTQAGEMIPGSELACEQMNKIDKLVERAARELSEFKDWDGAREFTKDGWRHKAKQILFGNNLYLRVEDNIPELCAVNLVEGRGYPNCMRGWLIPLEEK